jgi:hypothetical protein
VRKGAPIKVVASFLAYRQKGARESAIGLRPSAWQPRKKEGRISAEPRRATCPCCLTGD